MCINNPTITMEHSGVSIYYVQTDGGSWAGYIQNRLALPEYNIESKLIEFTWDASLHTRSSKLNLVFITPDFLELNNWDLLKEFNKDISIAILTGIDHNDIETAAKMKGCEEVSDWMSYELEGNDTSVRDLLILTISYYEGDHAVSLDKGHASTYSNTMSRSDDSGSYYDTLPQKTRQVNSVHDILHKDNQVYVFLERPAEGQVGIQLKNKTRIEQQTTPPAVYVFPYTDEMTTTFNVTLDGNVIGDVIIDDASTVSHSKTQIQRRTVSPHKPYVAKKTEMHPVSSPRTPTSPFRPSELSIEENTYTDMTSVENKRAEYAEHSRNVSRDQSKLDQIRELLEAETDPEQMLCRCLGIDKDIRRLDDKMKSMVECSETLKHLSFPANIETLQDSPPSTWPTLLHFGAQYNLGNFCDALLSNPLMYDACVMPNKDGHLPHDLARQHGHAELAVLLLHFSNYVQAGKEGKYDSGFSGCSMENPRLSTITSMIDHGEPTPTPHHMSPRSNSDYMTMDKSIDEDDGHDDDYDENTDYVNEEECYKIKSSKSPGTKNLRDLKLNTDNVGCRSSDEEQYDYLQHSNVTTPTSRTSQESTSTVVSYGLPTPPFKDILDLPVFDDEATHHVKSALSATAPIPCPIRNSRFSNTSLHSASSLKSASSAHSASSLHHQSSIGEEELYREDSVEHKHKNLNSVFGDSFITPTPKGQSPKTIKKKTSKFNLFSNTKKKHGSHSDPQLPGEYTLDQSTPVSHRKKDKTTYRRPSDSPIRSGNRSSEESSGHSSTYSDISSSGRVSEHKEGDEVNLRGTKTKQKGKKKLLGFIKRAKNRQSVRVKHAIEDKHDSAPSLPSKTKLHPHPDFF